MNKRKFILAIIVVVLGTAGYFLPHGLFSQTVYIHVTGAVKSPGIIEILKGDNIQEAIDAAGGALPQADLSGIGLNNELNAAQTLEIPCKD